MNSHSNSQRMCHDVSENWALNIRPLNRDNMG